MQVFKLFIKLLYRYKKIFILYTSIFLAVTFFLSSSASKNKNNSYQNQSCKFTICDNDNSEMSKALTNYLKKNNKQVEINDFDKETIQDELFNRNIDCAIFIEKGFSKSITENDDNAYNFIIVNSIPKTTASSLITGNISNYIRIMSCYIQAGYSDTEAVEMADATQSIKADTKLLESENSADYSRMYYFFVYHAYIFVVMVIIIIGNIFAKLHEKEIRDKIKCSSYSFMSFNKEVFFGILATGGIMCIIFTVFALIFYGDGLFTVKGGLFLVNMIFMMLIALSIAYFISQLVDKDNVLTMIANIAGLGCAFLSGVFVPMEVLDEGVIKAAHALPTFWYANACNKIDKFAGGDSFSEIIVCLAIELLFVAAFLISGIVIAKFKGYWKVDR